jgi:DNA-binding NarL/FixJ family response regulator
VPHNDATNALARHRDVGVLIVDDQPFFRSAARDVVGAVPGFQTLAEASSGEEAVATVGELHPELVLLDVRMPGMDGVETARRIKAGHPHTVIVLISIEDVADLPAAAHMCGAAALVSKRNFGPAVLRNVWAARARRG